MEDMFEMKHAFTYGQILRSTSIMGSSAAVVTVFVLVKTKAAAEFLGVTGVGVLVSFTAIQSFAAILFGIGLGNSGVRAVAGIHLDQTRQLSRIVTIIRRLSWTFGLGALVLIAVFGTLISEVTFGTNQFAVQTSLLGLSILFTTLTAAEYATLQGTRRIGDLAKATLLGNLVGTSLVVAIYLIFGVAGVVPAMIVNSLAQFLAARTYSCRIGLKRSKIKSLEFASQAKSLVTLGASFMWSGLLVTGVTYYAVILITRVLGLDASAYFGGAFAIAGAFVGFLLGAMGADYFPRISRHSLDHPLLRKLVNEQTEVGVLLATPGLVAGMFFAPWLLTILYSSKFAGAAPIMQLFLFWALGKVVSWPLSYVLLALGKNRFYLLSETTINITHVILITVGLHFLGLVGVGIAFGVIYLFYTPMVFLMVRKVIGFKWSRDSCWSIVYAIAALAVAFMLSRQFDARMNVTFGLISTTVLILVATRILLGRMRSNIRTARCFVKIPKGAKFFYRKDRLKENP